MNKQNPHNISNENQLDLSIEELATEFEEVFIINTNKLEIKEQEQEQPQVKEMQINPTTFLTNALKNKNSYNASSELELLSMIPNWSIPNANALSRIFHTFKGMASERKTDIPVGIPIFSYLVFLASQIVKNDIKYIRPNNTIPDNEESITKFAEPLNIWMLLLADSGDSKTFTLNLIKKAMNVREDFSAVNSALALAQSSADNPNGLWVFDEFGQWWEDMQGKQLTDAEKKRVLLTIADGSVEWKSKATQIEARDDLAISFLGINTEHQFNKATSDDSLKDGLVRRFCLGYVVEEDLKSNFNHLSTNRIDIINEIQPLLLESVETVKSFNGSVFTFDKECYQVSSNVFALAGQLYLDFMDKAFIKTYINNAYKFAIYMHIITKQSGTVISPETMEKGLAVSLVLLESFKKFLLRRVKFERKSNNPNNRKRLTASPKKIHKATNSVVETVAMRLEKLKAKEQTKGKALTRREVQRTYPRLTAEEIDTLFELYTQ